MAWLMVLAAGALEMVWTYSAKQADGFTNWGWAAVTIVASLASFLLLTFALRSLPLGTAYAAWTGIGAVGSFAVGVFLLGESMGFWRVVSALLIVAGVIGLRLTPVAVMRMFEQAGVIFTNGAEPGVKLRKVEP